MAAEKDEQTTSLADEMMAEAGILPQPQSNGNGTNDATDPPSDPPGAGDTKPTDSKDDKETDKVVSDPPDAGSVDPAGGTPDAEIKPPAPAPEAEISDEKLIELLKKKTGRDISLEDLKGKELTDQEKAARAEQQRSQAIEFGKANKLFSQAQYDSYVKFTGRQPLDVVAEDFTQKLLSEDPDLTQEEALELFQEFYHQHEDEDSLKYKQAQKLIQQRYDEIQRKEYGSIVDITSVYEEVQGNIAKGVQFKNHIEEIFDKKLPQKFEFTIEGEKISYPVDVKDKKIAGALAAIKQNYLSVEMMQSSLDQTGKVDDKGLLEEITKDLKLAVFEGLVSEVAKAYSDNRLTRARMGRKGALDFEDEIGARDQSSKGGLGISDQLLKEAGMMPAKKQPA